MVVIDIRGTHGSGKSWIPHQLISRFDNHPAIAEGSQVGVVIPQFNLVIVGKYETACGGCDGVKTADEVCRRVEMFFGSGYNVILEGILVSHTYKRYADLATRVGKNHYHFMFLNTPLKKCIWRVRARRRKSGNKKPLNPKNLIHDYHQIWERVRIKMKEGSFNVTEVSWKNPLEPVLELLNAHSWK